MNNNDNEKVPPKLITCRHCQRDVKNIHNHLNWCLKPAQCYGCDTEVSNGLMREHSRKYCSKSSNHALRVEVTQQRRDFQDLKNYTDWLGHQLFMRDKIIADLSVRLFALESSIFKDAEFPPLDA